MVSHGGFDLHLPDDTEHLFAYLSATWVSSLEKCLFRSPAYFLIRLGFYVSCFCLFVLLLSLLGYLYILDL